jgi:D-alanine-D-alanine ligase-like ATP-grasp enzyme
VLAVAEAAGNESARGLQAERFARMGEALRRAGFAFDFREFGREETTRRRFEELLRECDPDLVFCSFFDSGVYHALAQRKIPFVGSTASALRLCRSKSRLKRVWEDRGIATPGYFSVRRTKSGSVSGRGLVVAAEDFPYIVKPDGEDEDRGIRARYVAFDALSLAACVDSALEEYDELLIEHFPVGSSSREYTVAMIGSGDRALMLPAEIGLKGSRPIQVVTLEDRERGLAAALAVEGGERERLGEFARRAFMAAGLRDYARCELVDEGGSLLALELKGQPRMPDPLFDACAAGAGLDPDQYVVAVALAALLRCAKAGNRLLRLPPEAESLLPESVLERL